MTFCSQICTLTLIKSLQKQARAHLPHVGVNLRCDWQELRAEAAVVSSFFQLPDALFSRGREKEGGWGSLSARQTACCSPHSVRTVLSPDTGVHRSPLRLPGRVTTGRRQSCWPRWQKWPRSRVCPSPKQQPLFPVPVFRVLCCSSRRLLASDSRQ